MLITEHKARVDPGGKQKIWVLPESLDIEPLVADLQKYYQVRQEKGTVIKRKWFDTDDWQLYRRKLFLFYARGTWQLIHLDSNAVAATFSEKNCAKYRFAWDFPTSKIRSILEPILTIRTLLPLMTQETASTCFRILNKDRKTVSLAFVDEYTTLESIDVYRSLSLKGVRGYGKNFSDVSKLISAHGVDKEAPPWEHFVHGVKSVGRLPLDYTSKFDIRLQDTMSARQAMVKIYKELLQTIEHNEKGVIADLDTEFLHDFRVAIRRTRSGLGQVKEVMPTEVVERARNDFAWLGSISGPTRDLDVYLLDREKYMARLPKSLQVGLKHFFADISKQREKEKNKLVSELKSRKYKEVISHWHAYLHGEDLGEKTANSNRSAIKYSSEIIYRKYRRILKKGGAITSSSPDEDLHRLRIQCKKLRYTLEFFSSLFPTGKIKTAIKQLKRLQDNLGTFNDLSVQQDMLREYLAGLKPGSRKNQELVTVIGGLLTNLYHEHQKVRDEFASRFEQFACEKNQRLYMELFC